MPQTAKGKVTLSVGVEPGTREKFQRYCASEGRRQEWAVARALELLYEEQEYADSPPKTRRKAKR